MCLGNISKNVSVDNMKKTRLNGYIYDFSVDCDAIPVDDILDIHKHSTKKAWYKIMFEFIKKSFVLTMCLYSCNALNVASLNATPLKCVSIKSVK